MTKKVKKRKVTTKIKEKPIQKKIKVMKSPDKVEELKKDKPRLEESIGGLEEDLDENKFVEFLQPLTKSTSPVLEKVADAPQQFIRLEQDVADVASEDSRESQLKYTTSSNEPNYDTRREEAENQEASYQPNEIVTQPERINMENVGRNLRPAIRDVAPINQEFQETARNTDYVELPKQLERTSHSPHEQRETEAQKLESRTKKYEIR